jgi:outer membrane protein assembly factor BamD (BamD/ComL family)
MSHERRFPAGQLAEERDVMLIEAYLQSHQPELARARIATYRAAHPTGLQLTRVRELEQQLPPAPP